MSIVYRGVDTRLDRPVAIKIMDARFAGDPAFRIRFEREARSAARIDHPAVVDVHDQGADRRPAVPRHGAGRRRHAARRAARPGRPRRARGVRRHGAGAGRARRGAPARDRAPRRQAGERADLRGPAGRRSPTSASRSRRRRRAPATRARSWARSRTCRPSRSPPARPTPAATSTRRASCSTSCSPARRPYTGDTAISVAYRHVNCDVPAPSEVAGDVPPELDAFVRRATRRDPEARPADAAAMLAELRQLAAVLEVPQVPVPAPPPKPVEEQTTLPARAAAAGPRRHPAAGARRRPPSLAAAGPPAGAPPQPSGVRGVDHAHAGARAAASALDAWWLGSGRWTAVPSLTGRAAGRRRAPAHGRRPGARDTARLRDATCRKAWSRPPSPGSATALLRGSTVTLVVSQRAPDRARHRRGHRRRRRAGRDPRRPAHARAVGLGVQLVGAGGCRGAHHPEGGHAAPAGQPGDARGEPRRRGRGTGAGAVPDRPPVRRGRGDPGRPRPEGRGALGARPGQRPGGRPVQRAGQPGRPRHDDRAEDAFSRAASRPPGTPAPRPAGC